MTKLSDTEEKLLRQLLEKSKRVSEHVITECDQRGEYTHCKDAVGCLILIEKLSLAIGLIENKPDKGNNLLNAKLPFND